MNIVCACMLVFFILLSERSYPYETVMEEHSQDTGWDFWVMLRSFENSL